MEPPVHLLQHQFRGLPFPPPKSAILPTNSSTLAQRLGRPIHRSALLRQALSFGLCHAEDFTQLAYQRGLRYYMPPDWGPSTNSLASSFPAEALAIALLHPCLPYDPQRLRVAAAMVAAPEVDAHHLAHLAVQERAEDVLRFIAEAGQSCEPSHPFWKELLAALPASRSPLPSGVLPHPSRFMSLTGRTGPGQREVKQTWIRPVAI